MHARKAGARGAAWPVRIAIAATLLLGAIPAGAMHGVGVALDESLVGDVEVVGNVAFVGGSSPPGLSVLDVSNPAAPSLLDFVATTDAHLSLTVSGSYVYALTFTALEVFDVSVPASVVHVASLPMTGGVNLVASSTHVYVAGGASGLRVADIATPATPVELTPVALGGPIVFVTLDGSELYAVGTSGLGVISLSLANPGTPVQLDAYPSLFGPPLVSGTRLFVGDEAVLDISDPANLSDIWTNPAPLPEGTHGGQREVALSGDALLVATSRELRQWDVSLPAPSGMGGGGPPWSPTAGAGHLRLGGEGIALVGGLALVAGDGLIAVDYSDSSTPRARSALTMGTAATDVAVSGSDHVAVATGSGGLRMVDVADPGAPVEVGSFVPVGTVDRVLVSGTVAYTGGSDGVRTVDVSDPTSPSELDFVATAAVVDLDLDGTTLYPTFSSSGSATLDCSVPTACVQHAGFGFTGEIEVEQGVGHNTSLEVYLTYDVTTPP